MNPLWIYGSIWRKILSPFPDPCVYFLLRHTSVSFSNRTLLWSVTLDLPVSCLRRDLGGFARVGPFVELKPNHYD